MISSSRRAWLKVRLGKTIEGAIGNAEMLPSDLLVDARVFGFLACAGEGCPFPPALAAVDEPGSFGFG